MTFWSGFLSEVISAKRNTQEPAAGLESMFLTSPVVKLNELVLLGPPTQNDEETRKV